MRKILLLGTITSVKKLCSSVLGARVSKNIKNTVHMTCSREKNLLNTFTHIILGKTLLCWMKHR